jgi:hypothetical protein
MRHLLDANKGNGLFQWCYGGCCTLHRPADQGMLIYNLWKTTMETVSALYSFPLLFKM